MIDYLDLSGKSIVITGAASGIGQATALAISEAGANVILLDINEEGLIQTQKQIDKQKSLLFTIDLTKYELFEEIISQSVDKFGKLHGFVHSAGIEYTLPIKSMKPEHYMKLFSINTIAGFELARIISKKKYHGNNGASFIFIASVTGLVSRPGIAGYSASKGAIISGVRSIALELANKNIRVNCISPGTVKTDLIQKMLNKLEPDQREKRLGEYPLGIGNPEDIGNLALFLLSDNSRWITGSNVVIDGGYTLK
jgi:NAD(P)-dependent dehydrogenase (short-subunit alcohol dehydrogenase family)